MEGLQAELAGIEEQYQGELVAINALKLAEEELEKLREEAKVARDKRIEQAEEMHRQELIAGLQTYFDGRTLLSKRTPSSLERRNSRTYA